MAENAHLSMSRLCIFCRCIEPTSQPCPQLTTGGSNAVQTHATPLEPVTPLDSDDAALLEALQKQPSSLCLRCSDYRLIDAFKAAEPLDPTDRNALSKENYSGYLRKEAQYEMRLGLLSELHLTPSCQLCRLIYRVMPRSSMSPDDSTSKLTPFRSVVRRFAWSTVPRDLRSQSAIFLGIHAPDYTVPVSHSINSGADNIRLAARTGEAIALDSCYTFPGRKLLNAKLVDDSLDFGMVKKALELCEGSHDSCRRGLWPASMALTQMVDVVDRRRVPCPDDCDYIALSYVWGKVKPADDALEKRTLPPTIEDAITVTKNLGRRYLWVDALCIDQNPSTPDEAAAKQKQLEMMDLIYECATLTIIELAGSDSNSGIPGVSKDFSRTRQSLEHIAGMTLFTIPPTQSAERDISVWQSRAWTFQEDLLSRRRLYFSKSQAQFVCGGFDVTDADDPDTGVLTGTYDNPLGNLEKEYIVGSVQGAQLPSQAQTPFPMRIFSGFLSAYTSRWLTNDGDSLNAFLGALAVLERRLFQVGFIWGLPLQSHPQSLGWIHDRRSYDRRSPRSSSPRRSSNRQSSPRRRADFPSWSWAGWEGIALFPDMILEQETERRLVDPKTDLEVRFVAINDKQAVVEGWVVTLEIRTEPFSEVLVPGSDEVIGSVMEGNFLHNNTIPSGRYSCLVVQRTSYKLAVDAPQKQRIFLLILDWAGGTATRKTLVTLMPFSGRDFMEALPTRSVVKLI